jgi:hypothetical protein
MVISQELSSLPEVPLLHSSKRGIGYLSGSKTSFSGKLESPLISQYLLEKLDFLRYCRIEEKTMSLHEKAREYLGKANSRIAGAAELARLVGRHNIHTTGCYPLRHMERNERIQNSFTLYTGETMLVPFPYGEWTLEFL